MSSAREDYLKYQFLPRCPKGGPFSNNLLNA